MKHRLRNSPRPWALLLLIFVMTGLVACQQRGSSGSFGRFPGGGNDDSSDFSFDDGGSDFDAGGGSGGNTNTNPQPSACDQLVDITFSVTDPCGAVFQNNSEEISDGCNRAFNGLYNFDCNGLENRIRTAISACNSDVSAFWNFLPADCRNSLSRFYRRK